MAKAVSFNNGGKGLTYRMNCSKPGQFYGKVNETLFLNGVILNDSEYVQDFVDWRYHENAYFTFLLAGGSIDGNRKTTHEISAGSLLFQNWQDPHYNAKSNVYTRGFHVEVDPSWFTGFDIPVNLVEGSIRITDPAVIKLMYNVLRKQNYTMAKASQPSMHYWFNCLGRFLIKRKNY